MIANKRYPKVLVGSPVFDGKDYIIEEWAYMATHLPYSNYELLLVDNSKDNGAFCDYVRSLGVNCVRLKKRKEMSDMEALAESHELLRQHALRNRYDYLLHLEVDVFPRYDTIITDLLSMRRQIASGIYHKSLGERSALMLNLYEGLSNDNFTNTFTVQKDAVMFLDGTVKQVQHAGIGCIMFHKSALDKFKFRYVKGRDIYPDILFSLDASEAGLKIFVDTNLLCAHRNAVHGLVGLDYSTE